MTSSFLSCASWPIVVVACLTIGLAPFRPPHVVEKLHMLASGHLTRPIDVADLVFHGAPWLLLASRAISAILRW